MRLTRAVVPLMLDAGTGSVVNVAFLLSDDGTNVNGAILASDGGWSAL
ncbi:hypothetical protein SAMN04487916_106219 [Arthrobacter sp. ov407]|nr:hypothetical protein [Arthrobacter sp. ov407]SDL18562.1 hypothetical protein SAMN04487916_106219 [Arthrobacter sp. ov407]